MNVLQAHFEVREKILIALAEVSANSGHPIHKGTPREAFIREFLADHHSETVAFGTGEIIDANSKVGEARNQHDVVVYKRNCPKITFGGGVNGYIAESVIATIEVKSRLTLKELKTTIASARKTKELSRTLGGGLAFQGAPEKILTFLVAYDAATDMDGIVRWLQRIHRSLNVNTDPLLIGSYWASPSLDGIFILGKGIVHHRSCPIGFGVTRESEQLKEPWTVAKLPKGSLLVLFAMLTRASMASAQLTADIGDYLTELKAKELRFVAD